LALVISEGESKRQRNLILVKGQTWYIWDLTAHSVLGRRERDRREHQKKIGCGRVQRISLSMVAIACLKLHNLCTKGKLLVSESTWGKEKDTQDYSTFMFNHG
jgi:hypothetical protein